MYSLITDFSNWGSHYIQAALKANRCSLRWTFWTCPFCLKEIGRSDSDSQKNLPNGKSWSQLHFYQWHFWGPSHTWPLTASILWTPSLSLTNQHHLPALQWFACLPQDGQDSPKPTLCGLEDHKSLPTCKVRREVWICVSKWVNTYILFALISGKFLCIWGCKDCGPTVPASVSTSRNPTKGRMGEVGLSHYSSTWWSFELSFGAQTNVIIPSCPLSPNRYYFIYDNGDRQGLFNAYHAEACFSLTVLFSAEDSSSSSWVAQSAQALT